MVTCTVDDGGAHPAPAPYKGTAEIVSIACRASPLKRMAGRLYGGIPLKALDMHTLYTVRAPNGALCPGRLLALRLR
ncbi:hypothetical protein [Streptomyces benahoarensis]|uniref:hypothetical protein n=1 Tax=Streptomyces benahoarensis TaxID=2595054 RepID=UPI00163D5295|nr:hypothetical protein [Streptomyces benahoarensis]